MMIGTPMDMAQTLVDIERQTQDGRLSVFDALDLIADLKEAAQDSAKAMGNRDYYLVANAAGDLAYHLTK